MGTAPSQPVASLPSGTYTNVNQLQGVTLSTTTSGTNIRYTLYNEQLVSSHTSTLQNGTLLSLPTVADSIIVKLWGGAGSGGGFSGNFGGGGGFTQYRFVPQVGYSYYISVGRPGRYRSTTGGTILRGGNAFSPDVSGCGGDASCLIQFYNNTYTLMAVAGGGGGGGSTGAGNGIGGAGGGSAGQTGMGDNQNGNPAGGSNGTGGYGFQGSGQNCILTSANITGFGGAGADSTGSPGISNGGGGGYGGGGTSNGSGGGGGGGLFNTTIPGYVSGFTTVGSGRTPANTTDAYYANNAGLGGIFNESGNGGLIVVIINEKDPSSTHGTLYSGPFSITTTNGVLTRLKAISYTSTTSSTISSYIYACNDTTPPPAVNVSPTGVGIVYQNSVNVSMTNSEVNAKIRYTIDNTDPTTISPLYSIPITISGIDQTKTLKVAAFDLVNNRSPINTYSYVFDSTPPPSPIASPNGIGIAYQSSVTVTLSCTEEGVAIRYTTNGNPPTNSSELYSTPITLSGTNQTKTLRAIAYDLANNPSAINTYTYTFDSNPPPAPIASPEGVDITYRSEIQVTLSCNESGVRIFYTIDGNDPTNANTLYSMPITISGTDQTIILKIIAYDLADNKSSVNTYIYTFDSTPPPAPTAYPNGIGTAYQSSVQVSLSCREAGVKIYHTLDGSTPTNALTPYSIPITISGKNVSKTLKVIAYDLANNESTINTYTYTFDDIPPPTPIASPTGASKSYNSSIEVTLTCTESGVIIYYTIGSSIPNNASTQYLLPITLSGTNESKTLNVIAYDLAGNFSTINTYTYVFDTNSPPMPTAFPIGQDIIYRTPVEVTLSCTEENTKIYYTINGTTPTDSSSEYKIPITISGINEVKVLKIVAYDLAGNASIINSYEYTFDTDPPPLPTASPTGIGSSYKSSVEVTLSCAEANTRIYYTLDGSIPTDSLTPYSVPIIISGTNQTNQTRTLKIVAYDAAGNISTPVNTYTYVFNSIPPPAPIASPTGLNSVYKTSVEITLSCEEKDVAIYYTIGNEVPSDISELYFSPIIISGTNQSKTLNIVAYDLAGNVSSVNSYTYTFDSIPPPVPTAFPTGNGVAYTSSVEVTLNCEEEGALIYYTTNGDDPSDSNDQYLSPLTITGINETVNLQIIAYDAANNASEIGSYLYIFDTTPPPAPTANPTGQLTAYKESVDIILTCTESDVKIYYTVGAIEPSNLSTLYEGKINISGTNESKVLKIIAYDLAGNASDINTYTYVFDTKAPPMPTAYPTGENKIYQTEVIVELSCVENDAVIRYTLDGYEPLDDDEKYQGPITISGTNETIILKIKSFDLAGNYSSVNTYEYKFDSIPPPDPTAYPTGVGTSYVNFSNVEITLTCDEKDVAIYYNITGGYPNTLYSAPFIISGVDEVKVLDIIAYDSAENASERITYNYEFLAYAPTSSLPSGTYYNLSQLAGIELTSYVENSTIYYTLSNTQLITYYTSTLPESELVDLSNVENVTIKLWGAGGSGGNVSGNTGGSGGYTEYTFNPDPLALYYISVGRGGMFQNATKRLILPGGTTTLDTRGGGDASCLIKFIDGTYILMAVAGGGGAGGTINTGDGYGGAGGGAIGQNGYRYNNDSYSSGGANGIGGDSTDNSGQNCSISSNSILLFGGAGGDGIQINTSSAGGGGYGGGGSSNGFGAAGGGGFINVLLPEYLSGSTVMGYYRNPPNISDVHYVNNAGIGGLFGENGNNGLIVIIKKERLPSVDYGTEYIAPFDISANDKETITLKVRSYYNGNYSLLGTYSYYYDAYPPPPPPTANPTGEGITYLNAVVIPITINSEPNTIVYYTLDGSTPSQDSILYTAPLNLTGVRIIYTLKVIAYNQYNIASTVNTYLYEFRSDNGSLARLGARIILSTIKTNKRR